MKLWRVVLVVVAAALGAEAQNYAVNGSCTLGGQATVTQGMASSGTKPLRGSATLNGTGVMASYPGCTVTVFQTGTNTPALIYSTASGGALSNPFTGDLTDGSWVFFAPAACYDIRLSSGATQASTMPNAKTFPGVCAGAGNGGGGGGGGTAGTQVTVNGTAAVPNALNFSNVLLPPANGTIINFLLNGNNTGAYLPGNGNASNCLSGTGTWVACSGGGGGGGTLPTTTQYDLFASTGAGAAQASGILGNSGFVRAQVYTATGDVTSASPGFQLFPNASVEYFPTGYANSQGNFGAANGLALYMSHSGQTSATGNGGIALGGGNSSGTGNQVYVDCEVAGCDFKVPLTVNGAGVGGGGGGGLPTIPAPNLFASNGSGSAVDSGVLGQSGFLRAYVLEATGTGTSSPFAVPNGSIEYFPTGGYGVGGVNGVALHVSHSGSSTGFGGIALAGGNTSGVDQPYLDCEGPPVVPALGCDFKVPVTINGAAIGGGGTAGVTSINGTAGAFNFSGTAVSCSGVNCTFTAGTGGGGSGTVASGTGNYFAWYPSTGTTVNSNSNLSDNGALITSQEPLAAPGLNVTGSGGIAMTGVGGTLPAPVLNQGGIGIGPGNVPEFYSNGGAWTAIGSGGGGTAGVSSINGTTGAFTFSGAGVSCATTTCTFAGGGSGTAVSINGTSPGSTLNLTNTATTPLTNGHAISWTAPASGASSAYLVGDGSTSHCLLGNGTFGACPGGGTSVPLVRTSQVCQADSSAAAAPVSIVLSGLIVNAGDTVVVAIGTYSPSPPPTYTVSDSAGNTYTQQVALNRSQLWTSPVGVSQSVTSVTVTRTAGTADKFIACVVDYAGVTAIGVTGTNSGLSATVPTGSLNVSAAGHIMLMNVTAGSSVIIAINPGTQGTSIVAGGSTAAGTATTAGNTAMLGLCENTASAAGSLTCNFASLNAAWSTAAVELIGGASGGGTPARYTCTIAADAPFTATAATICSQALGTTAKQWIIHCNLPFNFTSGTGTANIGINLTATPTFQTYITTMLGAAAGPTYGSVAVNASGNTQMITRAVTDATLYTLTLDGTIVVPASTTFSVYGTTTAGTAAFRPGVACVLQ